MDSLPTNIETRDDLELLANQPRVLVRRSLTPRKAGRCFVYWMPRATRIVDNHALDVAIEAGNLLGLPVVVYFQVIPSYPGANLRHYRFLQQGLRDVEQDAAERGVGFVLRRSPENSLEAFLEEVDAALMIGDENPCREPERWRRILAKRLRLPFWTVDADVVVFSRVSIAALCCYTTSARILRPSCPTICPNPEMRFLCRNQQSASSELCRISTVHEKHALNVRARYART